MSLVATDRAPLDVAEALRADRRASELARIRVVLLGALIVLVPLASARIFWTDPGGDANLNRAVALAPFDLALLGLLVVWLLTDRVGTVVRRPASLPAALAWALALWAVVALVAHPSPRGVEWVIRIVAGVATVDTWRVLPGRHRRGLLGVVLAVAAVQSLLALVQSARGEAFGIEYLDFGWALYEFGTSHAGRGGLTHPYHLVVLLLAGLAAGVVALRSAVRAWPWLVGLAACGAGVGVTYSRASLLALVPMTVIVLVVARRTRRPVLAAGVLVAALGFGFSALAFGDGWYARYVTSTGESADSGRTALWGDAIDMAADNPVVGVGPGRYTIALSDRDIDGELLPAHNVVLHYAAELGTVGGLLVAALGIALAGRLMRRGGLVVLPAVAVAPFFVLDAYPYTFPTGLVITSLAAAVAFEAVER